MLSSRWRVLVKTFLSEASKYVTAREVGDDEDEETLCGVVGCGHVSRTRAGDLTHKHHKHGHRSPWSVRLEGTVCPFCGLDCRSILRVRNHMTHSARCATHTMSLPVLDETTQEEVDRAAAAEQRRARSVGIHWGRGEPSFHVPFAVPDGGPIVID